MSDMDDRGATAMETDPDLLIATQDFQKLERTHVKAGFREGVEEGKREVTEKGFNQGFREAVQANVRWARLRGRLSALEMFLQQQDKSMNQELCQLKEKIERLRRVGGEGGGGGGGEVDEKRELWEILEKAEASTDLVESERQIEDAITTLEQPLLQTT